MEQVAILIPCYNEEQTIKKVVSDCARALEPYRGHVYVYDNNSTDRSAEIAASVGGAVVLRREYKQGKGNVIRRMFREIDAQCYVMIDADDTYPTERIAPMIESVLRKNVDMVVGDRLSSTYFSENKRRFHNFGNVLVRNAINLLYRSDVRDIMTGLRAFSYEFAKTFPVLSQGFEIETEMTIHALDKNMLVENVVIEYRDRPEGSNSKLNTYADGFRVIATILRLFRNYKPLGFFSLIAGLLLATALAAFVPSVWIPYLHTGEVANFPTLIVCGFVVLSAILSYYCGLMLQVLAEKERREFEFRLQSIQQYKRAP
ncbi:MAG: glycosyltransferase [Clostridiales bacterium]|nr:glycosyltransferase [Clostridiales bacterium]